MTKAQLEKGEHKFIVIEHEGDVRIISKNLDWHKDIYNSVKDDYKESEVRGGGRINFDPDNKVIDFQGRSGSYGSHDSSLVKKILQEEFPDFTVRDAHDLKLLRERRRAEELEAIAAKYDKNVERAVKQLPLQERLNFYDKLNMNSLARDDAIEMIVSGKGPHILMSKSKTMNSHKMGSIEEMVDKYDLFDDKVMRDVLDKAMQGEISLGCSYVWYTRRMGMEYFSLEDVNDTLLFFERSDEIVPEDISRLADWMVDYNLNSVERLDEKERGVSARLEVLESTLKTSKRFIEDSSRVVEKYFDISLKGLFSWYDGDKSFEALSKLEREAKEIGMSDESVRLMGKRGMEYLTRVMGNGWTPARMEDVLELMVEKYHQTEESVSEAVRGHLLQEVRYIPFATSEGAVSYSESLDSRLDKSFAKITRLSEKFDVPTSEFKEAASENIKERFADYMYLYDKDDWIGLQDGVIAKTMDLCGIENIDDLFIEVSEKSLEKRKKRMIKYITLSTTVSKDGKEKVLDKIVGSISSLDDHDDIDLYLEAEEVAKEQGLDLKNRPAVDYVMERLTGSGRMAEAYNFAKGQEQFDDVALDGIVRSTISRADTIWDINGFTKKTGVDLRGYKKELTETLDRMKYVEHKFQLAKNFGLGDDFVAKYALEEFSEKISHGEWNDVDDYIPFIPADVVAEKVDELVEKKLSEGNICLAARIAEKYDRPEAEHYNLIVDTLRD